MPIPLKAPNKLPGSQSPSVDNLELSAMLKYGSGEVAGLSLPESAFCTRPPHDFAT